MKSLLASTAMAVVLAAGLCFPASADIVINGVTYVDPTSFHVTSSTATGSDPVLLNTTTAFSIQDIGGQNIDQPLTVYIAAPTGAPAPTITSASYLFDSQPATPVTVTANGALTTFATTSSSDLYTAVGCVACDNSLNGSNITAAYSANGITVPNNLTIYSFTVDQSFQGKDEINFIGTFAAGDLVFPYAQNVDSSTHVTIFDTSWTNTGFVNCSAGTTCTTPPPPPPPPPPLPEPGSLVLLGSALLGFGLLRRRKD